MIGWDAYWSAQRADIAWRERQASHRTCDNCGGEGGFYVPDDPPSKWSDPTPGEKFIVCAGPDGCGGSGFVAGEPEPLGMVDLDERCGDESVPA